MLAPHIWKENNREYSWVRNDSTGDHLNICLCDFSDKLDNFSQKSILIFPHENLFLTLSAGQCSLLSLSLFWQKMIAQNVKNALTIYEYPEAVQKGSTRPKYTGQYEPTGNPCNQN